MKSSASPPSPSSNEDPLLPAYLRTSFISSFPMHILHGSNSRFYRLDFVTTVDAANRLNRISQQQQQQQQQQQTGVETLHSDDAQQQQEQQELYQYNEWQPYELSPEQQLMYQQWLQESTMSQESDMYEQWQQTQQLQERTMADIDNYRFLNEVAEQCMSECFLVKDSHHWRPETMKMLDRERRCVRRCARLGVATKLAAHEMMSRQQSATIFGDDTSGFGFTLDTDSMGSMTATVGGGAGEMDSGSGSRSGFGSLHSQGLGPLHQWAQHMSESAEADQEIGMDKEQA